MASESGGYVFAREDDRVVSMVRDATGVVSQSIRATPSTAKLRSSVASVVTDRTQQWAQHVLMMHHTSHDRMFAYSETPGTDGKYRLFLENIPNSEWAGKIIKQRSA